MSREVVGRAFPQVPVSLLQGSAVGFDQSDAQHLGEVEQQLGCNRWILGDHLSERAFAEAQDAGSRGRGVDVERTRTFEQKCHFSEGIAWCQDRDDVRVVAYFECALEDEENV